MLRAKGRARSRREDLGARKALDSQQMLKATKPLLAAAFPGVSNFKVGSVCLSGLAGCRRFFGRAQDVRYARALLGSLGAGL